jgi:2-polyprenyl-6-hydroxyphenyl methylase/3-demethylubiquinone-9 3-methyltransferase
MINLNAYQLTPAEKLALERYLQPVGSDLSLDQLWKLMDQVWLDYACDNRRPDPQRLAAFYRDPIWLLNGIFIEQHDLSMRQRHSIAKYIAALMPKRVIDFGGGFGTLARLLAQQCPASQIDVCEPFPPEHGVQSCQPFANISFVSTLDKQNYDVLVSTDVLEHVLDPLALLVQMIESVKPGGHLIIANCFYPVIACHLPSTFHLRHSFDKICCALGLELIGPCHGSHAIVYRRVHVATPDWPKVRQMERQSKSLFPWRDGFSKLIAFPRRLLKSILAPFLKKRSK